MHSLRHYEVRLRRSRRKPYVIARWALILSALVLVLAVIGLR